MKKGLIVGTALLLVGAFAVWAQYGNLDDFLQMRQRHGKLILARDYAHAVDGYTTLTAAQKSLTKTRFLDALCSAPTVRAAGSYLTANEKATARTILESYIDSVAAEQAAERQRLVDEIP